MVRVHRHPFALGRIGSDRPLIWLVGRRIAVGRVFIAPFRWGAECGSRVSSRSLSLAAGLRISRGLSANSQPLPQDFARICCIFSWRSMCCPLEESARACYPGSFRCPGPKITSFPMLVRHSMCASKAGATARRHCVSGIAGLALVDEINPPRAFVSLILGRTEIKRPELASLQSCPHMSGRLPGN